MPNMKVNPTPLDPEDFSSWTSAQVVTSHLLDKASPHSGLLQSHLSSASDLPSLEYLYEKY